MCPFCYLGDSMLQEALKEFPSQNVSYAEIDGKPSVVAPAHVNLGIAIDLPKPDGTRALLVPSIKKADTMSFTEYTAAYEDLVTRARNNKLTAADHMGATHHRCRRSRVPGRVPGLEHQDSG